MSGQRSGQLKLKREIEIMESRVPSFGGKVRVRGSLNLYGSIFR